MAELDEVLKDFEQRLSSVEAELRKLRGIAPAAEAEPRLTPSTETPHALPAHYEPRAVERAGAANAPIASVDSSTVLAIIGVVFVILAGAFFIKMSVDSGFLTPIRQVILATVVGVGFFLAPQFLAQHAKAYGAILAGAGTTILHLTWVGAFVVHQLVPATVALLCAGAVGIGSVVANFADGSRIYLLVAMAGTYLALPIVGYNSPDWIAMNTFLVIWNVSFSLTALVQKRRDVLFVACYFALFTLLLMTNLAHTEDQRTTLLVVQLLQLVVFGAAMLTYSVKHHEPLTSGESVALLIVLLLFYWSSDHLVSQITPSLAPLFGLAIGSFVMVVYYMARRYLGRELKSDQALITFTTITWVHCLYFQLLSEPLQPIVALVLAMGALLVWHRSPQELRIRLQWPLLITGSTVIYGAILTFFAVDTVTNLHLYNLAYGLTAVVTFGVMGTKKQPESRFVRYAEVLLGFGHLEVLLGLYRLSLDLSWSGALFVSMTWGLYAVLILAAANWWRDRTLGHSALLILLAVGLKAVFYDLVSTTNLVRVGCLLGGGLLLYGCGWVLKKMRTWEDR
ncbi:MAG: DUF2339 domain-containing protein [Deltaproteobacteria bacterium]|nr:DUF2339 domain-containing protein [Deltaproteobacteria bacterium]